MEVKARRLEAARRYLQTPAGAWGESQQAYMRLLDECYSRRTNAHCAMCVQHQLAAQAIEAARAAYPEDVHPSRCRCVHPSRCRCVAGEEHEEHDWRRDDYDV